MKNFVALGLVWVMLVQSLHAQASVNVQPNVLTYGKALSQEQLELRSQALVRYFYFAKLKWPRPNAVTGAKLLFSQTYRETFEFAMEEIQRQCQRFQLTPPPRWLLEALCYLESNANLFAVSPTGPKGPFQYTRATAINDGLAQCGKYRGKRCVSLSRDDRQDLFLSAVAAGMHLARQYKSFGSWSFAAWEYHSGAGVVQNFLDDCHAVGFFPSSTTEIIFGVTPFSYPSLYPKVRLLMSLKRGYDQSLFYWHRVLACHELLVIGEADLAVLEDMYRLCQDPRNEGLPEESQRPYKNRFTWWQDTVYNPGSLRVKLVALHYPQSLAPLPPSTHEFVQARIGLTRFFEQQWQHVLVLSKLPHVSLPVAVSSDSSIELSTVGLAGKHQQLLEFLLDDFGYAGLIGYQRTPSGNIQLCPAKDKLDFFQSLAP